MIIVLNGPLGIGKSTLAEALAESIDQCVLLDGDYLVAVNPPPADPLAYLHATLALFIAHHRSGGYRHFVIDHLWRTPAELAALRRALLEVDMAADIRCFLLKLGLEENLRRIQRRQVARALDEQELELRTVAEERELLFQNDDGELREPFDVSAPPLALLSQFLSRSRSRSARAGTSKRESRRNRAPAASTVGGDAGRLSSLHGQNSTTAATSLARDGSDQVVLELVAILLARLGP